MAQEGLEPSASLVLSESGLPIANRAANTCTHGPVPRVRVELTGARVKAGPLNRWRTWAFRGGSRGTRTHKRPEAATCFQDRSLIRPDGFREDLRLELRGLESNQRPPRSERGVTTTSNCPGFGKKDSNLHRLIQSQGAYRLADSRERPAGVEPACRAWEARA